MPFAADAKLAAEVKDPFGQYLDTFTSERGQVRADLFRRGDRLEAHVSFSSGVDPTTVTDRYVTPLWDYAREHGFEDRLRMILS